MKMMKMMKMMMMTLLLMLRARMRDRVFFGNLNASWKFRVNISIIGWDIGDTGVEEGSTLMMRMLLLLREWSSWRTGSGACGHPLEPTPIPPPLPYSKSGIWVEWLRDGLVGTSREISMAGRPFEEPPHQLFWFACLFIYFLYRAKISKNTIF